MIRTPHKLALSTILVFLTGMLQTAHAGDGLATMTMPGQFTVQLPAIDRAALADDITALRSRLIHRKQDLGKEVAERKMDGSDAVITAIMPGGLLYAGYKKMRYERTRGELEQVAADIEDLTGDIEAIRAGMAPAVVAQRP
ncbi:MAG: hypothetical protein R3308_08610 [Thiohalobacterales bacterium]|nr:hypothetical protein [Thiohalobacterales bacterium]